MTLIFGTKPVFKEVDNWQKFGVDIRKHFWEIQISIFLIARISSDPRILFVQIFPSPSTNFEIVLISLERILLVGAKEFK